MLTAHSAKYEKKVSSLLPGLFYNLFLALLILICSEIGRVLGLPTGLKISVFWPAAGVSLAALLLFGLRLTPGIFLGALLYNSIHLIPVGHTLLGGIFISFIFSLGSTLQALLAYYILIRFASVDFYNRFRDTLIFLLPAGILSCLVASALSVGTLILTGYVSPLDGLYIWLTFWIGDTAGVYLITPLMVGFAIPNAMHCTAKTFLEAGLLFLLLVSSSFSVYFANYPLAHLLLPFLLWGAFRFNIRGASVSLLVLSIIAIVATATNNGPFFKVNANESLFFLITFINVLASTMLILISVINERIKSAQLLREYNTNLEGMVEQRTKQLQETREELRAKEKLASLGVLASGISYEIHHPLAYIRDLARTGEESTRILKKELTKHTSLFPELVIDLFQSNIATLTECLQQIAQNEQKAHKTVDLILQRSRRQSGSTADFHAIPLHKILDATCADAQQNCEALFRAPVKVIKIYDEEIQMIDAIEEDLLRVFFNLFENALYAMSKKLEKNPDDYEPTLTIKTKSYGHTVEISVKDNGIGMSDAVLRRIFQPFFSTRPLGEGTGLGLALSYDIIVQEHHGTIVATSQKDIFTEIVITLPKNH